MDLIHSIGLKRAAKSSDAQLGLMRDSGLKRTSAERPYISPSGTQPHLSRIRDKLRKEYDGVIPVSMNRELGQLLRQLDRAA